MWVFTKKASSKKSPKPGGNWDEEEEREHAETEFARVAGRKLCYLAFSAAIPLNAPIPQKKALAVKNVVKNQRRRHDTKNKIGGFEGGWGVGAERKIVQNRCFFLGNAMTIQLWKCKYHSREIDLSLRRIRGSQAFPWDKNRRESKHGSIQTRSLRGPS